MKYVNLQPGGFVSRYSGSAPEPSAPAFQAPGIFISDCQHDLVFSRLHPLVWQA